MDYWLSWVTEGNDQVKEVAIAAERLGFTGVLVADHVAVPQHYQSVHPSGKRMVELDTRFPDPFVTVATMAAVTSRLQFMSYVYVLPLREPFSVAKQVGTVAAQSDHRFSFGIGAGWLKEEFDLLGHPFEARGRRMDEMITILRDLWEDGEAQFDGEFFSFDRIGMFPLPGRNVPILVGGKSPAALRRAARNDGWLGMNYGLDEVEQLLVGLNRERARYLAEQPAADHGFYRFVIVNEVQSAALFERLANLGIDATIAICWDPADPKAQPLDVKLAAMERFAEEHIAGRRA